MGIASARVLESAVRMTAVLEYWERQHLCWHLEYANCKTRIFLTLAMTLMLSREAAGDLHVSGQQRPNLTKCRHQLQRFVAEIEQEGMHDFPFN